MLHQAASSVVDREELLSAVSSPPADAGNAEQSDMAIDTTEASTAEGRGEKGRRASGVDRSEEMQSEVVKDLVRRPECTMMMVLVVTTAMIMRMVMTTMTCAIMCHLVCSPHTSIWLVVVLACVIVAWHAPRGVPHRGSLGLWLCLGVEVLAVTCTRTRSIIVGAPLQRRTVEESLPCKSSSSFAFLTLRSLRSEAVYFV